MKINKLKKYLIVFWGIMACCILLGIYMIIVSDSKEWSGTYRNTFMSQDEDNEQICERFTPTLKIEDKGENYSIKVSFKTIKGPIEDNGIGTQIFTSHFVPVEVSKELLKEKYIFYTKPPMLEEEIYTYFEIEYIDADTIQFRYADGEEELKQQEYYVLNRIQTD